MTMPLRGRSFLDLLEDASLPVEPVRGSAPVVLYTTPWLIPDAGWAIASRLNARAMRDAGVDVRLISFDERVDRTTADVLREVEGCVKPTSSWDLQVLSAPLGLPHRVAAVIGNLAYDSARSAMHVMFESLRIDPEIAEALNSLSGVFTHSTANRDALVEANVRDVEVIGIPWFDDDPLLRVPKPERSDRFLWVGREEFRKAPENLVQAFLRAFPKNEATLTLKVSSHRNPKPYPSMEEIVNEALDRDGRAMSPFKIVRGTLSREKMQELYASHDVYCSASRGEGWDLPAYSMKLAGRRVVTTDSGGPRDFLSDGDILVPRSGELDGYADYKLDDLVLGLQTARSEPGPGSRVTAGLRSDWIGKKFAAWVERLTA